MLGTCLVALSKCQYQFLREEGEKIFQECFFSMINNYSLNGVHYLFLFFISCVQCICLSMLLKAVLLKCDPHLNITKAVLSCLQPFLFAIRYKYMGKQKVLVHSGL